MPLYFSKSLSYSVNSFSCFSFRSEVVLSLDEDSGEKGEWQVSVMPRN